MMPTASSPALKCAPSKLSSRQDQPAKSNGPATSHSTPSVISSSDSSILSSIIEVSRHATKRPRATSYDDYVIFRRCPTDAGRVFEMTDYNGGGHAMRMSFVLLFLLTTFSVSAAAADADQNLKQEVEKVASAYAQSFNRQDGAGIAALYASGGMYVNPAGPRTDIAQFSEEAFKAGFNHL